MTVRWHHQHKTLSLHHIYLKSKSLIPFEIQFSHKVLVKTHSFCGSLELALIRGNKPGSPTPPSSPHPSLVPPTWETWLNKGTSLQQIRMAEIEQASLKSEQLSDKSSSPALPDDLSLDEHTAFQLLAREAKVRTSMMWCGGKIFNSFKGPVCSVASSGKRA